MDQLDAHIDKLLTKGKIGSVAYDNIQAYSDDVRVALESAESQHYRPSVFVFDPVELNLWFQRNW